jgi:hypothetical protein
MLLIYITADSPWFNVQYRILEVLRKCRES